jgi:hypothetical protein
VTSETAWRKSSRCGSTTCVEVARDGDDYLVRDSKHPDQPPLRFTRDDWIDFLKRIEFGEISVM